MAVWQFTFYIIPGKKDTTVEGEAKLPWGVTDPSLEKIGFLPKNKSWSNSISQYGKDDETCIEYIYDDKILSEIKCRLDLRSLTGKQLEEILEYSRSIGGIVFYQEKTYCPDPFEITQLIMKSAVYRFCKNPQKFLSEIG